MENLAMNAPKIDHRRSRKGHLYLSAKRKKKSAPGLRRWQAMKRLGLAGNPDTTEKVDHLNADSKRTGKGDEAGTSQDSQKKRVQQQNAQSGSKLDPRLTTGARREDGLTKEQCEPVVKLEMDWDYEVDCGPILEARLSDQANEPGTSQDDQRNTVQQLNTQSQRELGSNTITGDHGNYAGPSKEQCYQSVKIEQESDDEIDSSVEGKWENDEHGEHGPVDTGLVERAGSSYGHFLPPSHIASEPESFLENIGDHNKVERLCRLCLVELNAFTYIYEFDDIHRFNVADAINDLLGMDLNPDDGYPTKICSACLEEVAHFRRFKGKCFESKAKLKDMVDEKNYYNDQMKLEDGDTLFESEENVVNDIPTHCKVTEVNPVSEDDDMLETHVKCEIMGSDEEEEIEEIGADPSSHEIDKFVDSHQSRSAVGKSQEDMSHSSKNLGRVTVKKQYLIFCQPVNSSDKKDDAVVSNVTVSGSGLHNRNRATKNSRDTPASSSKSPLSKNGGSVPVTVELSPEGKPCNQPTKDQRQNYSKGRKLAS